MLFFDFDDGFESGGLIDVVQDGLGEETGLAS